MSAFDEAWEFLQRRDIEGGGTLVNDPNDPGGMTKWGISQRSFPGEDIANLTEERAQELFRIHYWERAKCSQMPRWLAIAVADAAFNQGVVSAVSNLQRSLKVTVDGKAGPATIAAAMGASLNALDEFLSWRALDYSVGKLVFRRGWFRRLFVLHKILLRLASPT